MIAPGQLQLGDVVKVRFSEHNPIHRSVAVHGNERRDGPR